MTDLKGFIIHQLRELRREMLAALDGLSDEELTSHEPNLRNPIAWIVQHCCLNVDFFINKGIRGELFLQHAPNFLARPSPTPKPGDPYPSGAELRDRWSKLLDAGATALEGLTAEQLQQPSCCARNKEPLVESCLRVINHQNAHLRQIWCILGRRRRDDKWPRQETWLA
jgi:hypothetical protein